MQTQNRENRDDRIAVIGMACAFAGARDLREFCNNILNGVDAIRDVSPKRWDPDIFYDPNPASEGKLYCKKGGWIDSFEFNPLKYGMMPSATEGADPEHLLVLRTVFEAMEDAGCLHHSGNGQRATVILGKANILGAGQITTLYRTLFSERVLEIVRGLHPEFTADQVEQFRTALQSGLPKFNAETAMGLIPNVGVGNVSNRLDFNGRNFTIDAACASSLIAVDLGIRDLLSGAVDLAVVGGVHTNSHLPFLRAFEAMRATSVTSTLRPFDCDADGTVPGEGIGVLILQRLQDAEESGKRIYSVIRGTGCSSDGKGKSITAPRVEGEELALRRAYEVCGLSPHTIELIEAHGTGTPVGDTVEIETLQRVFGPIKEGERQCPLGSVKSMIGHTMPAAGAAGLIKMALSLYHKVLPPTINFRTPHPSLANAGNRFYVNTVTRPWIHSESSYPRRASVNAFGFGGVNAHVVIEEYTADDGCGAITMIEQDSEVAVLEAESLHGLRDAMQHVAATASSGSAGLMEIARESNLSLRGSPERISFVASSLEDLAQKIRKALALLASGPHAIHDPDGIYYFPKRETGKLAVVFPGEGSQYVNMLSGLSIHFPEVREMFDWLDPEISSAIYPPPRVAEDKPGEAEARLWSTENAVGSVLTADGAIWRLLSSLRLKADMVAGHSCGEYIALIAGGVLDATSFRTNLRSLAQLFNDIGKHSSAQRTTTLAVGTSRERAEELLADNEVTAQIALDNCPHQVLISIDSRQEALLADRFRKQGLFVQTLPFDHGYHTPEFLPAVPALRDYFSRLEIRPPQIPVYSPATASTYPANPNDIAEIVASAAARPVLFRQTIEAMYADGARIFVEAGPRGNLSAFIGDILRGRPHRAIPIDKIRRPGVRSLNHAIAVLCAERVPLDMSALYDRRPKTFKRDDEPGAVWISNGLPLPALPEKLKSAPTLAPETIRRHPESVPRNPADRSSVFEDHCALMESFLETHEAIATECFAGMRDPADFTDTQPSTCEIQGALLRAATILRRDPGRCVTMRVELNANEHLYLRDHCMYFPSSRDGGHASPLLCMPLTGSLEIMAEAAAVLCPELCVTGVKDINALRWIELQQDGEPVSLTVTAERKSASEVRVQIQKSESGKLHLAAEGIIILNPRYAKAQKVRRLEILEPCASPYTSSEYYATRRTFHGESFQGISALGEIGSNGIVGRVCALPRTHLLRSQRDPMFHIDPFMLDAAAQIAGCWAFERLSEGSLVLPVHVDEITFHAGPLEPGEEVCCETEVTEINELQYKVSFNLFRTNNDVAVCVVGWTSRRFYWPSELVEFFRFPERGYDGRSLELPPEMAKHGQGSVVALPNDATGLLGTIWSRVILNRREISEFAAISPGAQAMNWLMKRSAAKDAVRRWARQLHNIELLPADIEILMSADGRLEASGSWSAQIVDKPRISLNSEGPMAIAVAGDRDFKIAAGKDVGESTEFNGGLTHTAKLNGQSIAIVCC
jgi:acyl transferase domain-containing protein